MIETTDTFANLFKALTGHGPYPWQEDLYDRLVNKTPVAALDVSTGLGKTSVIPIWLCACLRQPDSAKRPPMRLVYVVNRRTIVDQATDEAAKLAGRVEASVSVRHEWDARFPGRYDPDPPDGSDDSPAAAKRRAQYDRRVPISTLRGALADNGDWLLAPHRPTVVVGTVDMIGSRLLFNGYRTGRWQRSRHAGLIGWDTLLVHDEAHLSRPFQTLLDWVDRTQPNDARRLCVLPMSATAAKSSPAESADAPNRVLTITADDLAHDRVRTILNATKRVTLHAIGKDLDDQLAALAARHGASPARVIVFVRRPETAKKVRQKLLAKLKGLIGDQVELLTGTIRGQERDELLDKPVLRHLLKGWGDDPPRAEFLIATSAGEVGADFDADHIVCDLTTLDAMIQRLGRVNRRGGADRVANIDVVLDRPVAAIKGRKASDIDKARSACAVFLERLRDESPDGQINASPAAITGRAGNIPWRSRDGYTKACDPEVPTVEPHPATLDAWSLTSVQDRWPVARPVEPYLHGLDRDAPQTAVAWRAELDELPTTGPLDAPAIEQVLEDHRLLPRELLQDRPDTVAELLLAVRKRDAATPIAIVQRSDVELRRAGDLSDDPKRLAAELGNRTVILPTKAGGLTRGMLDPAATGAVTDVADDRPPTDRARFVVYSQDAGDDIRWRSSPLPRVPVAEPDEAADIAATEVDLPARWSAARDAIQSPGLRMYSRVTLVEGEDGPAKLLLLYRKLPDPKHRTDPPTVDAHNTAVGDAVGRRVATLLPADSPEATALVAAAAAHDLGKAIDVWQLAAGRRHDDTHPLAKSRGVLNWRTLEGYRHEYGSLVQAAGLLTDPAARDLALHLIAAHHGRGRPHFTADAMRAVVNGTADAGTAAAEIAIRFDKLQRRYGHWGMAWLESILMSADAEVSTAADRTKGGQP